MKRLALTVLTTALFLGTVAFAQPTVVTSIHPVYDLTRQIAGEHAEVVRVLPPGMSPHTFDPTPRDVARISQADLVIMIGGYGIDGWLRGLVEASGSRAPMLELFEALEFRAIETDHDHEHNGEHGHDDEHAHDDDHDHDHGGEHEHDSEHEDHAHDEDHGHEDHGHEDHAHDEHGHDDEHHDEDHAHDEHGNDEHGHDDEHHDEHGHDEEHAHEHAHDDDHDHDHAHGPVNSHLWLDPVLMIQAVPLIAEALIEIDPDNAENYLANAEALVADLEALDAELREMLAPLAGEAFVPFHDAWPYFAERYDLDLVVEIEPFPGREPSPAYLRYALGRIEGSGARAIFTEPQLSRRPAEVVAESAGLPLFTMDPLGGTAETETYQDLLRHNARVLIEALGQGD